MTTYQNTTILAEHAVYDFSNFVIYNVTETVWWASVSKQELKEGKLKRCQTAPSIIQ